MGEDPIIKIEHPRLIPPVRHGPELDGVAAVIARDVSTQIRRMYKATFRNDAQWFRGNPGDHLRQRELADSTEPWRASGSLSERELAQEESIFLSLFDQLSAEEKRLTAVRLGAAIGQCEVTS